LVTGIYALAIATEAVFETISDQRFIDVISSFARSPIEGLRSYVRTEQENVQRVGAERDGHPYRPVDVGDGQRLTGKIERLAGRCVRNVECHDGKRDFAVRVVGLHKNVAKRALVLLSKVTLELRVLGHSFHYLRKDGAEICSPVEHEDGGFCVTPAQVGSSWSIVSLRDFSPFQNLHSAIKTFLPATRMRMSVCP